MTFSGGGLSRESLHIFQEMALLAQLNASDVKYLAIEEAKKLVENRAGKLSIDNYHRSGRAGGAVYLKYLSNHLLYTPISGPLQHAIINVPAPTPVSLWNKIRESTIASRRNDRSNVSLNFERLKWYFSQIPFTKNS